MIKQALTFASISVPLLLCLQAWHMIPLAAAVDTPWVLGDENSVACYTLKSKEDIPKPVGLEMHWTQPPVAPLDSTTANVVKYWARVQDNFWTHPSNVALLGADFAKYQRLCVSEPGGCDATGDCCIWHSNIHSCRAESGTCLPWVKAQNATDDGGAQYTLVTHTKALQGGLEEFQQNVQLDTGDWVIIGHVKIMTFQCAVGATRSSVAPPPVVVNESKPYWIIPVVLLVVIVGLLIAGQFYRQWAATAACPKDDTKPFTCFFVGIKNETQLLDTFPDKMEGALEEAHGITKAACKKHGCYDARRIGNVHMVVAKDRTDALACATQIINEFQKVDWAGKYLEGANVRLASPTKKKDINKTDLKSTRASSRGSRATSRRSRHSSVHSMASHLSRKFAGTRELLCNVGMWYGLGTIVHEEERGTYSYSGPVVDAAAELSDYAKPNQILTTTQFADECDEDNLAYEGDFSDFGSRPLRCQKRQVYDMKQYTPKGMVPQRYIAKADTGAEQQGEGEEAETTQVVGSIASALELSTGGLTTRRCAVCVLDMPALSNPGQQWDSEVHAEKVTAAVNAICEIAEESKGDVISVTDGRITIACNALTPCSAAPFKAANIARDCIAAAEELGFAKKAVSCGVAVGAAVVGVIRRGDDGETVKVLSGSAFKQARVCQHVAACQGVEVVTTAAVARDLNTGFYTQYFDFITWPETPGAGKAKGSAAGKVVPMVAIMSVRAEAAEDEWMYQLENSDATNPYRHVNTIFTEVEKACGSSTGASVTATLADEVKDFIASLDSGSGDAGVGASGAGATNAKAVLELNTASGLHDYATAQSEKMRLSM